MRRFASHQAAQQAGWEYWLSLSPEERLDAVGECVREYLALRNESEQGFYRVYRVLQRTPS
ncbi:MAG: hypothetical protein QNJ97_17640 [Myxococcota bacterium]|nr:hypothetical protein [Myxococcota bacterium]